jgi:hypothetical protein
MVARCPSQPTLIPKLKYSICEVKNHKKQHCCNTNNEAKQKNHQTEHVIIVISTFLHAGTFFHI